MGKGDKWEALYAEVERRLKQGASGTCKPCDELVLLCGRAARAGT